MTARLGELLDQYTRALRDYLPAQGEAALEHAYEIGRRAIAGGLGVVDLATAHQHALLSVLDQVGNPEEAARIAVRAAEFLVECVSPFEMTLRGFSEANRHLEMEVAERKRAEEALRTAHAELEVRVVERTEELSRANELLRDEIVGRQKVEDALRVSEERMRSLVETVRDYAILMLDPDGRVATWNSGAQRIKGYLPEEIIGKHFSVFYPAEEVRSGAPQASLRIAAEEGWHESEGWRLRKDGTQFWANVIITALRDESGRVRGFSKVTRDMTERKRAEDELQRLNAELKEANSAKDQFVALISHELRSPLSAILAGTQFLRRTGPDERRLQHVVDIIERNTKLQARLVNDLLDLSRLSQGKLQLQRAPLAVDSLVRSAVQAVDAEAKQAGLSMSVETEQELWLMGDFDRLEQVLLNLLQNAIKFTPAGEVRVRAFRGPCSRIEFDGSDRPAIHAEVTSEPSRVRSRQSRECAYIAVEDTGIGIDRELLSDIFQMFRQGDVAARRKPGLGLGLALVKGITEEHGGRVWAESSGPGKGSRFTLEVPLIAKPAGVLVRDAAAASLRIQVILVEDNRDTRELLVNGLELMGYEVQSAATAEEALEHLRHNRPDLILSDIALPGIDGYEFLRQARQIPGLATVPAFAVTGYGQEQDVVRAYQSGYTGHFVKPVDLGALDKRIRELFCSVSYEKQTGSHD